MEYGDMNPRSAVMHDENKGALAAVESIDEPAGINGLLQGMGAASGNYVPEVVPPTEKSDPREIQPGDEVHASAVFAWYQSSEADRYMLNQNLWNFAAHYKQEFKYYFGDAKVNDDDGWLEKYAPGALKTIEDK